MISVGRITGLLICILAVFAVSVALVGASAAPVISLASSTSSARLVSFTGSGFLPTDTTCSLSSPPSSSLFLSSACVIQVGTGIPNGGFSVGNGLPGNYVVQVTGNDGDFAQAILAVGAPTFSNGQSSSGRWISVQATGLLPTDTTCSITSPSSPNVILPGSAACVIQVGTGDAYGGFIVGNVLPGSYVIQVTGNQGDFAQTILDVN